MAFHRYYSSAGGTVPPPVAVLTPARRGSRRGRVLGTPVSASNPVQTANTGGAQLTGSGGPVGNPNWPCLTGVELLPMVSATLPVDQGTRYDFTHDLNNAAFGTTRGTVTASFQVAEALQQHWIAFDLYQDGTEDVIDSIDTVVLPLRRVDLGADAAVVGGGTALAALQSIGGSYVSMDASLAAPWVKLWFDPTVLSDPSAPNYAYSRVVQVGLRYLAWRDDSANQATVGEGFSVTGWDTVWVSAVTGLQYGNWLVTDKQAQAQVVSRSLGETNQASRAYNAATEGWRKAPFTVVDLARMGATDQSCFFQFIAEEGDFSQTNVYLAFVELVVQLAPERRGAVGTRYVTNIFSAAGPVYDYTKPIEWRNALDTAGTVSLQARRFVATIREAIPASPSDRYRALSTGALLVATMEAIGPSIQVRGVTQQRPTQSPQLVTKIGKVSDGMLVTTPVELVDYNLAVVGYDAASVATAGPFWWAADEETSPYEQTISTLGARGATLLADGVTAYTRIRVMMALDPLLTADLQVNIQQPLGVDLFVGSYTVAQALLAPDIGEGWRVFEILLGTSVTPVSGDFYVILSSTADPARPWKIAGSRPVGGNALYGLPWKFAINAVCDLATPPTPTVTAQSAEVAAGAGCGVTTNRWLRLTWTVDTDVYVYGVYRSSDAGVTYEANIALLYVADAVAGTLTFDDYAAPWDIDVIYALAAFRASDHAGVAGAPSAPLQVASGGPVFGVTDGTTSMIYAPSDESSTPSLTWSDLSGVEFAQLSGQTAQVPLRAVEERGLAFTVTVLIDTLGVCTTADPPAPQALTVAQRSLTPTPWDTIRAYARADRLDVRFPGGHTRTMSLSLGGLVARNQFGVYLAELTFTDIHVDTDVPFTTT